jgi:4-amino-4-deoxy-L-arabinose transferase-like glycosyltransferase
MLDFAPVQVNGNAFSSKSAAPATKLALALLIVLAIYVGYFSHLGTLGFIGPDEPRYAWIARGMAESGDWVTPRLYGEPWFEKPVLYYWGAAAAFKIFGVHETAARLPSALSALLGTLALSWLAWRLYGGETARWLLLLLPTTAGMIGFAHAAATDMPFSGMLAVAMVAAADVVGVRQAPRESAPKRTPWLGLILFGAFLGAATLAKGPAAIILAGGSVGLWAVAARRWSEAFRLTHPVAVGAFCAVALPWYVLCELRNPGFYQVFILEHNFARFLRPIFHHEQPFWFYIPVVLVGILPWLALVVACFCRLPRLWRAQPSAKLADLYFLSWAVFPVLFFSASKSKLPGYVLPALPALGLFAARMVVYAIEEGRQRLARLSWWLTLATPVLLAGGAVWFLHHYFPVIAQRQALVFLGVGGVAMLLVCGGIALRAKPRTAFLAMVIATLILLEGAQITILPWLDPLFSSRAAARALPRSDAWQNACGFGLRRGAEYGLNFYLRRQLKECSPEEMQVGTSSQATHAFVSPSGLELLAQQHRAYLVVDSPCLNTFLVEILPGGSTSGNVGGR